MDSFVAAGFCGLLICNNLSAAVNFDPTNPNLVHEHYIVKLKSDHGGTGLTTSDYVMQQADRLAQIYGVAVIYQYSKVLIGLAIKAKDDQIEALALDEAVDHIEANKRVRINSTQTSATWGLDRVDARRGLDGAYTYTSSGKNVHAYIIDTGLRSSHSEFSGRVGRGFSSVDDELGSNDCHGHGTHVAATVGGTVYGLAKNVTLHGVRVLDCEGSGDDAGVIAGIEWVAKNAVKPAVANMSLGGDVSVSLDLAVKNAVKSGVVFVAAAGNENTSACQSSPAHVPEAITVGATNRNDFRASYSNYGTCVDIFAPGSSITSAWNSSDRATNTISGTSMASPHVAGAVARYLEENPQATPAEVDTQIKKNGTPGVVKNSGLGSPNLFLYTAVP